MPYYYEPMKDSGIYLILNIMKQEAYVGQAEDFSKRTHLQEMFSQTESAREPNDGLWKAFQKNESLIHFPLIILPKEMLDAYECLFMTLLEQWEENVGFTLYNKDKFIRPEHRKLDDLMPELEKLHRKQKRKENQIKDFDIQEIREELDNDFKARFGMNVKELAQAAEQERALALAHYLDAKEKGEHAKNVFYPRKSDLGNTLGLKTLSLKDINCERLIITSAGDYLGESLFQILEYESQAAKPVSEGGMGYCLWTYSGLNPEFGRNFCQRSSGDMYLLIRYTTSVYDKPGIKYEYFKRKPFSKIPLEQQQLLLGPNPKVVNKEFKIPEGIDATGSTAAQKGFIISEFGILKESFNFSKFLQLYERVQASCPKHGALRTQFEQPYEYIGNTSSFNGRNDTGCIQLKDGASIDQLELNTENSDDKVEYIVAKLQAPYFMELE